jgi:olefin beta-lactone synthetase
MNPPSNPNNVSPSNILEKLLERVEHNPNKTAIIDRDGSSISYANLERRSAQLSTLLEKRGVKSGDAVMVLVPMGIDLYITLAAVFRLRAVVMVVDPSAGLAHIGRCCALNPPRALVGAPIAHALSLLVGSLCQVPLRICTTGWWPTASPWTAIDRLEPRPMIEPAGHDTPALLTFTSGTSGLPKAAMRSHGLLLAQLAALEGLLEPNTHDVDLATLPIVALANLAAGMTTVIADANLRKPGSIRAAPVLEQIQKHNVTRTAASPAMLERLADQALEHGIKLPELTRVFSGGGPVFPRTLEKLARVATNAKLLSVYGSTEAEPIAHVAFDELEPSDLKAMKSGKGLLVGRPVSEIQLRILENSHDQTLTFASHAELERASLGPNRIGEIIVSGSHVLPGYLHGHGDSETKVWVETQVWHRTGDAGQLDDQGRLWLAGRANARISDARGTIYPFSVECAALEFVGVNRCALIEHQQRRVLCVEWSNPRTGQTAHDGLLEHLAWAQLDQVHSLPSLPMDARHNAKVDLKKLRALMSSALVTRA